MKCGLPSVGLRMRTHADDVHMDIDHQPCEMSINQPLRRKLGHSRDVGSTECSDTRHHQANKTRIWTEDESEYPLAN